MEDIVLDNKLQLRGQFRKSGIIYGDVLAAIYEKNKIKKKKFLSWQQKESKPDITRTEKMTHTRWERGKDRYLFLVP